MPPVIAVVAGGLAVASTVISAVQKGEQRKQEQEAITAQQSQNEQKLNRAREQAGIQLDRARISAEEGGAISRAAAGRAGVTGTNVTSTETGTESALNRYESDIDRQLSEYKSDVDFSNEQLSKRWHNIENGKALDTLGDIFNIGAAGLNFANALSGLPGSGGGTKTSSAQSIFDVLPKPKIGVNVPSFGQQYGVFSQ